jgi:hypothetical protein
MVPRQRLTAHPHRQQVTLSEKHRKILEVQLFGGGPLLDTTDGDKMVRRRGPDGLDL